MSWNYNESCKRVCAHIDDLKNIAVKPLVKEANLNELLTERNCRQIYGAHLYAHPSEFSALADLPLESDAEIEFYRRMVRAVHVYQREVSYIVENVFDATRIHFQGVRLHSLVYRPIRNPNAIARRAFLQTLVLSQWASNIFNPIFDTLPDINLMVGVSQGEVIGTRNGQPADRELLFLGSPANHAAKILREGKLHITAAVFENLTSKMQDTCVDMGNDVYLITSSAFNYLDDWLEDEDIAWDRAASRKRVCEDKARHPLRLVEYSQARQKIDFDNLSIRNNKRVRTVTLYADVTGFTAYIDGMKTEADQQEALRLFHVIRRETSLVIHEDYEGVRVQFQGDRVQAIFHVPAEEHANYTLEAVVCAGALQASLEKVIRPIFPSAANLHLAIGCDLGQITATNLGARGHRDRICLGRSVEAAAAREEALGGGHTGISNEMYGLLPAALQKVFVHDAANACYVARNPTVIEIKRLLEADGWGDDNSIDIMPGERGVSVQPARPISRAAVATGVATAVAGRTAKASSSYAPSQFAE